MPLRRAIPIQLQPTGLTDAVDGTNVPKGMMSNLSNLMPSPNNAKVWQPRPAAMRSTAFAGFSNPKQGEALLVVGDIAYGLLPTSLHAGKSQPFAYNVATQTFETVTGITANNVPTSISTVGDWEPPTMAVVGTRIMVTHPGFSGGNKIGWFDVSGFTSSSVTGSTHTSTTLDTLSTNVLAAGWEVGMTVSSSAGDITLGTTITAIAVGGLSVTLSAAATGSNAGSTITVNGGTATSPQWGAGDTNITPLTQRPVAVAQFFGRAWYAVGAAVQFSDSLNATNITVASQALTMANGLPVTALGGLPLTQTSGGILQALICFQGDANMKQITGDPSTINLALNDLGIGVGTLAPNTICATPLGLMFVSPDGIRYINFLGQVSDPVGSDGRGIVLPFVEAVFPSRMCAAYNQDVYRVTVENGAAFGDPVQEYWYDFSRKIFSGPHTFTARLIQPLQGLTNHGFLIFPYDATHFIEPNLWTSAVTPGLSDTFVENGQQLSWEYQTVLLPDNLKMSENAVVETTLACAIPSGFRVTIEGDDEFGSTLDQAIILAEDNIRTIWGSFIWGVAVWTSGNPKFLQRPINWTRPLVFKQMFVQATGQSAQGFLLGNLNLRYQELGYLTGQS